MGLLNMIENKNNKIYALFFKTGKEFEALYEVELLGIKKIIKYEEYYLVYSSTKKISNEFTKYKLVYSEEISNGKKDSFYPSGRNGC
jgi:hypothetical protein